MRLPLCLTTLVALSACTLGSSYGPDQSTAVAAVSVSAPSTIIAVHSTTQLTAIPKNSAGIVIDGLAASWGTSNGSVANVDANGKVTGVAAGTATITATVSGVSGTLDVTVAAPSPHLTDVFTPGRVFNPLTVTIPVGDTVRFNISGEGHNVHFDPTVNGHPTDIPVTTDQSVKRAFNAAGTFPYVCEVHPGMSGQVVVQ